MMSEATTPAENAAGKSSSAEPAVPKTSNGVAADEKSGSLPPGIVPPNKTSTMPTQEIIERFAPGSAPHWIGLTSKDKDGSQNPYKHVSTTPRNLPVKRYDGEPLSRSDLQHNVLCYLFDDTRRIFTNPRPGVFGPQNSPTWRCPIPTMPYGMAKTCARPSDETPEEYQAWKDRVEQFESAPRVASSDNDPRYTVENQDAGSDAVGKVPPMLYQKEGYLPAGSEKLTFKELYMEALLHSGKCTRAMRDKMLLDEEFCEDFAKVCLLVNVGRINTTLAFYPEMKTILRSYHPLPSLQRNENSRRHLQDAPRMKSLLKAVLLDGEKPGLPGSGTATGALAAKNAKTTGPEGEMEEAPGDFTSLVRHHLKDPKKPPTSVVTVIFLLAVHNGEVATLHLEHPFDFFTLFFPHPEISVPSKERARVFMWLIWHYLEGGVLLPPGSHENPFDDDFSREHKRKAREVWDGMSHEEQETIRAQGYWKGVKNPEYVEYRKRKAAATKGSTEAKDEVVPPEYLHRIMAPKMTQISHAESAAENADTAEEIEWGTRMKEERGAFLVRFQEEEQAKIAEGGGESGSGATARGEGKENQKRKRNIQGGGSAYPLANILAAANAEKAAAAAQAAAAAAAAAEENASANGEEHRSKRSRGGDKVRHGSLRAYDNRDKAETLWNIDLTLPAEDEPPVRTVAEEGQTAKLFPGGSRSLVKLAWRRILDRAQRGVGDASYDSDEEDCAQSEAHNYTSRAEFARILSCLRQVRTDRGELRKPVKHIHRQSSMDEDALARDVDEELAELADL